MAPARSVEGDLICVLFGADLPMILRKRVDAIRDGAAYEFLGSAYVHQIMFDEAMAQFEAEEFNRTTFDIA